MLSLPRRFGLRTLSQCHTRYYTRIPVQIVNSSSLAYQVREPPALKFSTEFNKWILTKPKSQERIFFNKHFGYFCEQSSNDDVKGNGFLCQRGSTTNALYYSFTARFSGDGIKHLEFEISPHKNYGEGRATLFSIVGGETFLNWNEIRRVHSMLEWNCEPYVFVRMMLIISGSTATKAELAELSALMQQ
jgi:hypothetical protein